MTSDSSARTSRRRRPRKEHSLWFKVAVRTVFSLVGLFLLGVIVLVVIYLRTGIPQPNADAQKQSSIIYYSDGHTEIGRIGQVNRQDVKLSQVPTTVQHEFLSAEDRTFYSNSGISPSGIVRALWNNLRGNPEQGGSTITQQYVKNYFLSQDRSVTRKLKEAMISIKVDHKYSKAQILQDYLNNTYFGRGAYGIQAASKAYFNTDVSKLTVSQGAFLASVINAPGLYDPQYGPAAAQRANARMVYVLDGMVKEGWLSQAERNQQTFPTFIQPKAPDYGTGPKSFIIEDVKAQLKSQLHLTDQDIARGGLRITTTINQKDQNAAVSAVNKNVPSETARIQALHAGLVAQKPDGAVVAMYGGSGSAQTSYNSATQATMQAGSQFKVFTLTAALEKGIPLTKRYSGASPLVIGTTSFHNDLHEQFGDIDLDTALSHSVNTVFLQLNQDVGAKNTMLTAQKLGIPATDPGMQKSTSPDTDINNVLGVASVHVADMANAYSTVNNGGKRATPYMVQKVSSVEGGYSYQAHPKTTQVVGKSIADDVTNAMSHVLTDPGASAHASAGQIGRPAAGKTGTTDGFMSAWFTGFTPGQLTTSVGMYAGAGQAAGTKSLAQAGQMFYGGEVPATIWLDFMQAALAGKPKTPLPPLSAVNRAATATQAPVTTQPSTTSTPPPATSTTSSPSSTSSTSTPPSTTPPPSSTTPPTSSTPPPTSTPAPTAPPSTTQPPAVPTGPPAGQAPGAGPSRSTAPAAP